MINLLFLLLGFIPLIYGADLLIESASSLAKKLNIPNIVIGLTIIAFGTSAPELVVNTFASVAGNSDIVIGNVIGSNIFNILGILGISAIIYPLSVKTNTTWIEIPLCLLSAVIVLTVANDRIIDKSSFSMITRIDGIMLLSFFLVFLSYNFQLMKSGSLDEEIATKEHSIIKSIFLILTGIILLAAGGKIIVEFAVKFARLIEIPERIIALTILSIGTSLPELATSAVAAKKRNVDIAIGNIVGSNIFNAFFILGVSAVINPVHLQKMSNMDLTVNILSSTLLFIFIFTGRGRKIERPEGIIFIVLYLIYLAALILL